MEVTYATKAIVLRSEPWNDYDSRIVFYTKERGKLNLIARGTKRINSKLVGHLEPLNLIDLMVINGRLNYAGAAVNIDSFYNLKQDLEKLKVARQVIDWFDKYFKVENQDNQTFHLLETFLNFLNKVKSESIYYQLLASITILKLMVNLGQSPNLEFCSVCQKKIENENIRFDLIGNGAVCLSCHSKRSQLTIDLSRVCLEKIKLIINYDFDQVVKNLKINYSLANEINLAVDNFIKIFV